MIAFWLHKCDGSAISDQRLPSGYPGSVPVGLMVKLVITKFFEERPKFRPQNQLPFVCIKTHKIMWTNSVKQEDYTVVGREALSETRIPSANGLQETHLVWNSELLVVMLNATCIMLLAFQTLQSKGFSLEPDYEIIQLLSLAIAINRWLTKSLTTQAFRKLKSTKIDWNDLIKNSDWKILTRFLCK